MKIVPDLRSGGSLAQVGWQAHEYASAPECESPFAIY
jgi:hypothetical protein